MAAKTNKPGSNKAAQRREEKQRQQQRDQKTARGVMLALKLLAGALVLLILVGVGYAVMWNTDYFYRNGAAVQVGAVGLTVADYNFYFYRSYYEYVNQMGGSLGDFGIDITPDDDTPLDAQLVGGEEGNTATWKDFFEARAETLITRTFAYYGMAQEAGFALSEEQEEDILHDFAEKIEFEAVEVNGGTVDAYLHEHYGRGMDEETYLRNLRILFTANFYEEHVQSSIEIPDAELDALYAENSDRYAMVFYRLFYLSGRAEDEADQPAKMLEARSRAQEIAAAAEDEESFIALCEEYSAYNDDLSYWEGASTLERGQARYAMSYFREWLAEPGRTRGDVDVFEAANGYYVLWFDSRDDNAYPVVDLVYLTITRDSSDEAEREGKQLLNEWRRGEQTPEALFELAGEVRDIDYTLDNRRVDVIRHDALNKATIPLGLLDWCYGEQRAAGDAGVFPAEEEGAVLVAYFAGYGEPAGRNIAYKELHGALFEQWRAEALGGVAVEKKWCFFLTGRRG